jgi:chemotaxis protein methyltransferase CheR
MSIRNRRLATLVHAATGIRLREEQVEALFAALQRASGTSDANVVLEQLEQEAGDPDGAWLTRMIDEATVHETSFMRDGRQLSTIDWPRIAARARKQGRDRVRVWSAACASGEEAFTLALLAREALGGEMGVSVVATDISSGALTRAATGTYGKRSARNLSTAHRDRWLEPQGKTLVVRDELRRLVSFRRHNLARDVAHPDAPAPFDLVVCRNVLIYFDREAVTHALGLLNGALAPDGVLLLGIADRLCVPAARDEPARSPRSAAPSIARRHAVKSGRAAPRDRARTLLSDTLRLADEDRPDAALATVEGVLAREAMCAEAHFVRGLLHRALGDPTAAATALRAARYSDPTLCIATFELARAHEALGDPAAARLAYAQALREFNPRDARYAWLCRGIDPADVEATCRLRLRALGAASERGSARKR